MGKRMVQALNHYCDGCDKVFEPGSVFVEMHYRVLESRRMVPLGFCDSSRRDYVLHFCGEGCEILWKARHQW
jgi:hypothetical protein